MRYKPKFKKGDRISYLALEFREGAWVEEIFRVVGGGVKTGRYELLDIKTQKIKVRLVSEIDILCTRVWDLQARLEHFLEGKKSKKTFLQAQKKA